MELSTTLPNPSARATSCTRCRFPGGERLQCPRRRTVVAVALRQSIGCRLIGAAILVARAIQIRAHDGDARVRRGERTGARTHDGMGGRRIRIARPHPARQGRQARALAGPVGIEDQPRSSNRGPWARGKSFATAAVVAPRPAATARLVVRLSCNALRPGAVFTPIDTRGGVGRDEIDPAERVAGHAGRPAASPSTGVLAPVMISGSCAKTVSGAKRLLDGHRERRAGDATAFALLHG